MDRVFLRHIENGRTMDAIRMIALEHIDIQQPDQNGQTPLMHAVIEANDILVGLLLRCGADSEAKDNQGETALDIAKQHEEYDESNRILAGMNQRVQTILRLLEDKKAALHRQRELERGQFLAISRAPVRSGNEEEREALQMLQTAPTDVVNAILRRMYGKKHSLKKGRTSNHKKHRRLKSSKPYQCTM